MQYLSLSALSFLSAALFADFGTSLAPWDEVRTKHTWNTAPANWESLGHPPAGTTINLYIALKPYRESALIDALNQVSNPKSLRYGAHLSREQVAELVRPGTDTLELVSSWLAHHGVRSSSISTTHGGAWLTVTDVLVSQANKLLGASYQLYRHAKTNDTIIRTVGYALPTVLHAHVQAVAPTTYFTSSQVLRKTSRGRSFGAAAAQAEAASGKLVTELSSRDIDPEILPETLRSLYKTVEYVPIAADRNKLGVLGFDGEIPSQADLTSFMGHFRADAIAATFTVEQVNGGGNDQSNPGTEASIDVQYASAMAYPTPHVFYSIGGDMAWSPDGEPVSGDMYLEWFRHILPQPDIPQTISVSYGGSEENLPPQYAVALCNMFAQLGARGVSVLYPSGDTGVGYGDCEDEEGDVRFIPEFPASCPWVTSVGGTTGNPETAAAISGGGFSDYFPRPEYQEGAVTKFLQHFGDEYSGLYNPWGRGIPDVSAQAVKFKVIVNDVAINVRGTSCSTPTVAGIISLLNDYRISKGIPPLGFLNFWLYGSGLEGVNDITSGSNPGCNTDGFPAIPGWDPVTGLGTLNFEKLHKVVIPSRTTQSVTSATESVHPFSELLNNSDTK
ncbi:subtilisin-like protein [Lactarius psammicola]|nr:subtilisin-like protein [Lactarius psammicola]